MVKYSSRIDKIVSTQWVQDHMDDENLIIIESNEDVLLYESGHIPGAIKLDWHTDLNNQIIRDYISPIEFSDLMKRKGIKQEDTIVFYGDKSNWWASYALWVFELFGNTNTKIMNGGRDLWIAEKRFITKEKKYLQPSNYPHINNRDDSDIRIYRSDVINAIDKYKIVDVRSYEEYIGERTHMPGYLNEGALRGGHIPGALSIPWSMAVNKDGTFKDIESLKDVYINDTSNCFKHDDTIITYCRIGERSAHTWFVLKYLMGFNNVKNYDGSWTEYGNMVGVPIITGELPG